jgi:ABC-type sugar transport system ATPase subunit
MATLDLKGIHKHYGAIHAVKGIDLEIGAGEFTVLVGPSGCGKSTLLRAVAGLEAVGAGTIRIAGEDVTRRRPRDRDLAMVFQSYALYPYLTVYDNIAFGLRARNTAKPEIEQRVRRAADMLAISDLLKRYPRELSGGQRQRVAIGRAIVRDAKLYLFDEPLSNLDAKLRDEMREEIKRLHRDLGKTFLYVTHDQIEAMTLADRIVLLRDGAIEQQGPPLTLFERPINRFVASFLGSPTMNFLPVQRTADTLVLSDGQRLPLASVHSGRELPSRLVLGVRPEHFRVEPAAGSGLMARLEIIQPTGSRLLGSFTIGNVRVTAELDSRARVSYEDPIRLAIDVERTILIEPDSGRTIWPDREAGKR